MDKEQIYDEQIAPLMAEIITVCREHKIAMLASFSIPTDDDPDLGCTTALLSKDYTPTPGMIRAFDELGITTAPPMMIKTVGADGGVTMTAVLG